MYPLAMGFPSCQFCFIESHCATVTSSEQETGSSTWSDGGSGPEQEESGCGRGSDV